MAKSGMSDFLDSLEPENQVEDVIAEVPADTGPVADEVVEEPAAGEPGAEADAEAEAEAGKDPAEVEPKTVPISVVHATRREREDWKGKAQTYEGELKALREQLEREKAAAPPAQAAPAAPAVAAEPEVVPNPLEDPQGFVAYQERKMQAALFNERLNFSERSLRKTVGNDDFETKIGEFKKLGQQNPALFANLKNEADPYQWAYDMGARSLAMAEIGPDPATFKSNLEKELRAKWEAERAAADGTEPLTPGAPQVRLPQSLAAARSAAPRNSVVEAAPEFEDIFKPKKRSM